MPTTAPSAEIVIEFRDSAFDDVKKRKPKQAIRERIKELAGKARLCPMVDPKTYEELRLLAQKSTFDKKLVGDDVDVRNYYGLEGRLPRPAEAVVQDLQQVADIEKAYLAPLLQSPVGPPTEPTNPFWFNVQNHLKDAPIGVGARTAWQGALVGACGNGMHVTDLELGWSLSHKAVKGQGPLLLPGKPNDPAGAAHGTSVLGLICAKDDDPDGILGVAPHVASLRVISHGKKLSTIATAIATAALDLNKRQPGGIGGVLVLEVELIEKGTGISYPLEIEDYLFQTIRDAVRAGVVVIEPAGNGATNLDTEKPILKRCPGVSPFRDSGAIMVAGGHPKGSSWQRWSKSNHGSRIDCFAAATSVSTATYPQDDTYFSGFSGTSAATAIIAGVALSTQGMWKTKNTFPTDPLRLRQVLQDPTSGTHSVVPPPACVGGVPVDQWIGVMPDLVKIQAKI